MKKLNVPYRSQTDNAINPYGSCNVTSLAMGMLYYGIAETNQQLEDEIYQYCEAYGYSRHSPYDLACVFESFSKKAGKPCFDNFSVWGTREKIKAHIDTGHPVITHGYWTNFGHILVILGYTDRGFIVHDPYGEWYASRYDINSPSKPNKGMARVYSYQMMEDKCLDSANTWWVHYLSGDIPNYIDIDILKPELSGVRLQDIYEQELSVTITKIDTGLTKQVQWCLTHHAKRTVTIDGIIGPETLGAYKDVMDGFGLSTEVIEKPNAKLLIEGVE